MNLASKESSRKISSATLSEQIYHLIRSELMNGRFEPGDRIRIGQLSEEFGVSNTPVREAIFRLVSDQALEMKSSTSIFVRRLKKDEFVEIQRIRHLLEGEAALVVARSHSEATLQRLVQIQDQFINAAATDSEQAALFNREFHFELLNAANMPLVEKTVANLWVVLGPLLRKFHATLPPRDLSSKDHFHFKVMDAIRNNDGHGARSAIQDDIHWGRLMVDLLGDD